MSSIKKKLKVLDLFAGTRSISRAFEARGHETFSVEWDKQHENIDWYADISKITAQDILGRFGKPDVIWASFDCFIAGTLVWTDKGYKSIEEIECNDKVLTHKGRYKNVYRTIVKKASEFNKVKISGIEELTVTPEHPFLARKKVNKWNNDLRTNYVDLEEPEWIEAKDLDNTYRVGIPINNKSEIPEWDGIVKTNRNQFGIEENYVENKIEKHLGKEDFWWLIGRYMGDGSFVLKPNYYRLEICCGKEENEEEISVVLDRLGINYQLSEKKTTRVFNFGTKELVYFVSQFGKGSLGKEITPEILNLPKSLLKAFLEGYISADGYWEEVGNNRACSITTVNKKLAYGIQQCLLKAYGRYGSMVTRKNQTNVIEGRKVNASMPYIVSFYEKAVRQNYLIEDGMAWVNVSKNETDKSEVIPIYDLSVEDDESYTVSNIAVHNCTTYSVAGISHHRRKEDNGNLRPISDNAKFADELNKHVLSLIEELNPQYYFIENPRGGLRRMDFMQDLPRYTVTYCQYGFPYMKPTDLWTNHPDPKFKPPCKNGQPCHIAAPRGSRTGLQGVKGTVDRSRVPDELCEHIVAICEEKDNL